MLAVILMTIHAPTAGSEDGMLDLLTSNNGTLASRIRIRTNKVGINETDPSFILHVSNNGAGTTLNIECSTNDASSGADITLFRRRGASGAGQDNDLLSTIWFRGKDDAGTPNQRDYACIEAKIIDASSTSEDAQINFKVMDGGTLTTQLSVDTNLLTLGDAVNIATNTSTGSQICTTSSQKLAFSGLLQKKHKTCLRKKQLMP
jgi:hypothetical protein